jgi:alanyl-tRNA synthetase
LVVFVGEKAQKAGVNASALVKESSKLLKGSGGGSSRMAQGGGEAPSSTRPLKDLITRLVREATHK